MQIVKPMEGDSADERGDAQLQVERTGRKRSGIINGHRDPPFTKTLGNSRQIGS